MDSLNKERVLPQIQKARDLAGISTVACYIATNIFKLESERLRALSGINKLTNKSISTDISNDLLHIRVLPIEIMEENR